MSAVLCAMDQYCRLMWNCEPQFSVGSATPIPQCNKSVRHNKIEAKLFVCVQCGGGMRSAECPLVLIMLYRGPARVLSAGDISSSVLEERGGRYRRGGLRPSSRHQMRTWRRESVPRWSALFQLLRRRATGPRWQVFRPQALRSASSRCRAGAEQNVPARPPNVSWSQLQLRWR